MPYVINRSGKKIPVNAQVASNEKLLQIHGCKVINEEVAESGSQLKCRVGIGITTCNRPDTLKKTLAHINRYTPGAKVFVNDDTTRREGVARSKNNCLAELEDCDYIFLFDDDCYPVKHGWCDLFIRAAKETGNQHFSLSFDKFFDGKPNGNNIISTNGVLQQFSNPCGMMLFFTRRCIELVGGFDCNYDTYGHEHVGLSQRIFNAGLTTAPYLSVTGAMEYFYSYDFNTLYDGGAAIDKRGFLKKNAALLAIEKTERLYKPYKPQDCIMSVYLCSQPDSQRGIFWKPEFEAIAAWAASIKKAGLAAILFHDCFSNAQVDELTRPHLKFIRVTMPPNTNACFYRFKLYAEYLERFKAYYRNVFFTDCTDVEVLKNPFEHAAYSPDKIYVGDELTNIGCSWMKTQGAKLIKSRKQYAAFEREHEDAVLLNAGLLGGNAELVLPFAKDMAELCAQSFHLVKSDMPLFNYTAHLPKYKERIAHGPQVNTIFKQYETKNEVAWFKHK